MQEQFSLFGLCSIMDYCTLIPHNHNPSISPSSAIFPHLLLCMFPQNQYIIKTKSITSAWALGYQVCLAFSAGRTLENGNKSKIKAFYIKVIWQAALMGLNGCLTKYRNVMFIDSLCYPPPPYLSPPPSRHHYYWIFVAPGFKLQQNIKNPFVVIVGI